MLGTAMLHAQGVTLVQQETRDGKTSTNQIQLDKTHMRAETHSSGEAMAFTFDEGAQTARVMNIDKKTYIELNRAFMQQMQQQLTQFQEQLKNLPPEQRAILEQAMRGRGGALGAPAGATAAVAKYQYKQTGTDRAGQWSCTKYESYQGPQKVMELCTVDPKDLGVTAADFEVAKHLAEFLQGFLPQAANGILVAGSTADQGFSGIPVRRISFSNGLAETVSEIKEIRHEAIPSSAWEVPAGFKRENPPDR
jgi:HPt (histidine-containing phosphotransfer) domain-containing protein